MNIAPNFMSSNTAQEISPKKPAVNTTKNTAAGSGDRQDKAFSDALEQAEADSDAAKEAETKQKQEQMIGIAGFNPIVVMVDVSTIPVVQIAAQQQNVVQVVTSASPICTPDIMQVEGMENVVVDGDINGAEIEQKQSGFSNVLKDMTQLTEKPQEQMSVQNGASVNDMVKTPVNDMVKTPGVDLLNLLNGKVMQNVPQTKTVDTAMQETADAKTMEIPVQVVDETDLFASVKTDSVAVQAQPIVKESAVEEQLNAKLVKQNATLPVKEESGLVREPLRAVQEAKEQAADTGSQQNFNLGQNAAKKSDLEVAGKETESSGQQQFSHFVTSSANVRNNSTAVQSAVPQTPEQLEKFDIPGQIVQQARLIKTNEDTQMVIKLKPEHLGDLTLKITVEKGVVSATFHSDNAQVRTMLETTLMQLKQELIDQGIKVNHVSVYAGMGQSLPDGQGQQQTGREQQSSRYKNRKIDLAADFEDEVDKVSAMQPNLAEQDGVDYRV